MIETGVPLNTEMGRKGYDQKMKVVSDHDFFQTLNQTGFLLGCLIGCFIRFSSLGAIHSLTKKLGHHATNGGTYQDLVLSTIWSLVSCFMGFLILAFVKNIMVYRTRDYNDSKSKDRQQQRVTSKLYAQIFGQLEYTFSFGILSGACVSWTFTDLYLGHYCHAFITICILLCVTGCKMLFERYTTYINDIADDKIINDDKIDLSEPLLIQENQTHDTINTRNNSINNEDYCISLFKIQIIMIGVLVGIFIQLGTMGADAIVVGGMSTTGVNPDHTETDEHDWVLLLTLLCSFFFGSLGVMVLWIIRNLVALIWQWLITTIHTTHSSGPVSSNCNDVKTAVAVMEVYGYIGCFIGVYVMAGATMKNSILGLHISVPLLLLTLATAAIWFKLKSCLRFLLCPSSSFRNQDDSDPDQDSIPIIKDMLIV